MFFRRPRLRQEEILLLGFSFFIRSFIFPPPPHSYTTCCRLTDILRATNALWKLSHTTATAHRVHIFSAIFLFIFSFLFIYFYAKALSFGKSYGKMSGKAWDTDTARVELASNGTKYEKRNAKVILGYRVFNGV